VCFSKNPTDRQSLTLPAEFFKNLRIPQPAIATCFQHIKVSELTFVDLHDMEPYLCKALQQLPNLQKLMISRKQGSSSNAIETGYFPSKPNLENLCVKELCFKGYSFYDLGNFVLPKPTQTISFQECPLAWGEAAYERIRSQFPVVKREGQDITLSKAPTAG